MKRGYVVFQVIRRNKVVYFLLSCQLFLALTLSFLSIGMLRQATVIDRIVNTSGLEKSIYFTPNERFQENTQGKVLIEEQLHIYGEIEKIGRIYETQSKIDGIHSYVKTILYNEDFLKSIKFSLSEGDWFNTSLGQQEVPIIVGTKIAKKYKLGSNFYMSVLDINNRPTKVNVKVIGILKNNDYYINASGNTMTSILKHEADLIIMPIQKEMDKIYIEKLAEQGWFLFNNKGNFSEIPDELKSLSNFGELYTFDKLLYDFRESTKAQRMIGTSLGILTLLISIGGIGGNNALQVHYLERTFAIYYLLGYRWGLCVSALFTCFCLILVIPASLSLILIELLSKSIFANMILLDRNVIILCLLIIFSLFIITSLDPVVKLIKRSPIEIIKKWG